MSGKSYPGIWMTGLDREVRVGSVTAPLWGKNTVLQRRSETLMKTSEFMLTGETVGGDVLRNINQQARQSIFNLRLSNILPLVICKSWAPGNTSHKNSLSKFN